ncbi:DUF2180 family protein [Streptomyces sp. NPDC020883]|uniref:DUF2180 family protein n=1 Tax=Streptomyces sp. NPDC020883 TaxID=3365099 RepID=UPI00379759ED
MSLLKCFDCAWAEQVVDAVGVCHHCGVGVCLRHCHVAWSPATGSPGSASPHLPGRHANSPVRPVTSRWPPRPRQR